jgi:hypothetical protein
VAEFVLIPSIAVGLLPVILGEIEPDLGVDEGGACGF